MKKKLGISLLLTMLWIFAFPLMVHAGGTAASICVSYYTVDKNGGLDYFDSTPYTLSQTVQGPDGIGETNRWYFDNCFHYNIAMDGNVFHPAGEYKLTRIDYPAGYELDSYAVSIYPLSVVVTQAQLDEYVAWDAEGDNAGTVEYEIKVPIKKIGSTSLLLSKPGTPKIYADGSKHGSIYISSEGWGDLIYQVQYSTKKDSGYKTLYTSEEQSVNFIQYNALKDGNSYYFRARAYKLIGEKKVYSSYSKAVKVKVYKDPFFTNEKPQMKAILKNGKTSYISCSTYSSQESVITARFYYSDKKTGTYKLLATQNAEKISLKKLTKLKTGKTWYVKMRWSKKLPDGTTIYSKYSNTLTVKR